MHALDDLAQPLQLRGLDALGRKAADQPVQRGAHFVDLVGLLERDLADEHAAVLLRAHQPRLVERAERLAHRPAGDAQLLRDPRLVQLGARLELARDDLALELALHQRGERVFAQQVDRRLVRGGP